MQFKDAVEEVKENWRRILPLIHLEVAQEKVNNEVSYVCPFCGHGRGGDGLSCVKKDGRKTNTLHCFGAGCNFSGSVIDLYAEMKNRNINDKGEFVAVVKELADLIYIDIDEKSSDNYKLPPKPADFGKKDSDKSGRADASQEKPAADPPQDNADATQTAPERKPNIPGLYKDKIEAAADRLFSDAGRDALSYLHARGLVNDEILKRYQIGCDTEYFVKAKKNLPGIIFPHSSNCAYYSARSIQDKFFAKPSAEKAGSQRPYNYMALQQKKPCFVCEGQIDALSIVFCGGHAIALAGGSWENVLLPELDNTKCVLILALDNDPPNDKGARPGQDAQQKLSKALEEKNVAFIEADFSLDKYGKRVKDCNDMLCADADLLKKDVARITAKAERLMHPDSVQDYIIYDMQRDIAALRKDSSRKTGFQNLDTKIGCLHTGLHVIGGLSSIGKTSFCAQLCDQLAKSGSHVAYFSLEMSKLEMISKSISRYTRMIDPKHAVTGAQIRAGARGDIIARATKQYINDIGNRVNVVESNFNLTVDAIRKYIETYKNNNGATPIIFLDYLQILQPQTDPQTGRKATDPRIICRDNIVELKRISRSLQTPVIVLSSLNRTNYLMPIALESFLETSAIEYGSDTIFGLELACLHTDELFQSDGKNTAEKRKKIQTEKRITPRKIVLTCLKNRFGISSFQCGFSYDPRYDYFEPADLEAGFKPLSDDEKTPFDPEEKQETYKGLTVY